MKICFFMSTFLPKIGGAELAAHYLAEDLTREGHRVTVLAPFYRGKRKIKTNYVIHRFKYPPRWLFFEPILLLYLALEKLISRFDLLHVYATYPSGYCGSILKKFFRFPLIITPQGADIQKIPEIGYGLRLDPRVEKKIGLALKRADAIVSISDSIKRDIVEVGGDPKKIYDIPNGVWVDRFAHPQKDIRRIFHLNSTDRVILAVGRNHPKKGYADLIEAMALVKRKFRKAKCVIIGAGTENLLPMVKDLDLQGEVVLAGEIAPAKGESLDLRALALPQEDLVSAYLSSDIFVSPSLIEGFALVIPEALAAGLPVVATDVPGNRDAIVDGYNGLIARARDPQDLAEKILVLLEDEDLRMRMSANARKSSLRYDWGKITEEYIKVYEHLLAKVW
ncbi:hypothetical protein HKBW3S03_01100 [Candidatus Hakubella thermalkaliphila]|uniref:Glycosyltransferase subfamily 4-like N-terminal domain-containing protein n=4 Tax=Candidatus Hakubella thermalkaliphila TaxID=2754717 RepID=A0A6V8NH77_9ACTN|nr:N-acetyl-alpha-D-glucosaminyl L-malate synthase [Actinomycetota bacterium]GFP19595.1 hypothetical protein HKBW3S03_01100 [Candidatus Hakubella thermalkaliphila]GFP39123.1 hypothetical protein HKBW3S47_00823 [Candidatus Hakubella thermalkaliphila]